MHPNSESNLSPGTINVNLLHRPGALDPPSIQFKHNRLILPSTHSCPGLIHYPCRTRNELEHPSDSRNDVISGEMQPCTVVPFSALLTGCIQLRNAIKEIESICDDPSSKSDVFEYGVYIFESSGLYVAKCFRHRKYRI